VERLSENESPHGGRNPGGVPHPRTGAPRQTLHKALRAGLAIASGILLALPFPPYSQGWCCWIALIPLLGALWFPESAPGPKFRDAFFLGLLTGVTFFLISLSWLTTVSSIGWIALSLYLGVYPAVWAGAVGSFLRPRPHSAIVIAGQPRPPGSPFLYSSRNLRRAFLAAALWTGLELVRSWLFSGFGWNTLGVGLRDNLPLIQMASLTGAIGLSFLPAFANVILLTTARRITLEAGTGRFRMHMDFNLGMALLAGWFLFGVAKLGEQVETQPLRLAIVQANIPQEEKWDPTFAQSILQTYEDLTHAAAASDPDLIIWPEAATPVSMFGERQTFDFVTGMAALHRVPLLLGTLDLDDAGHDFNAAALIPPQPGQIQIYHKIHLVPFGEFIPFRKSFPIFHWIAGHLVPGDFTPGESARLFYLWNKGTTLAPLICFEDTLGRLVRRFSLGGAQVLINVTNDGWFLESAGAEQHLANAQLRTVETGLPLARSANTGVSCFIDRYGRVYRALRDEQGRPFVRGAFSEEVQAPVAAPLTFYSLHGELIPAALLLLGTGGIAIEGLRRRPRRPRKIQ
jgi:apolipoprotein N-acyltransferase